jgi:hemerythrin-like metal-binding protein
MELFPWKEEYAVNVVEIDEQHKKLLALVNQLHAGVRSGQSKEDLQKIFAGLLDYTLKHFETEEGLMVRAGFPDFHEHKMEHDEFRKKIVQFLDAFLDAETDVAMDMA